MVEPFSTVTDSALTGSLVSNKRAFDEFSQFT